MIGRALSEEVLRLGGDPSDPVWLWFLKRGPHGPSFTWGQTRREPPGYVGVEHLQEIVDENAKSDALFMEKARSVVALALSSQEPQIVRRAIQVAAVLGNEAELEAVGRLTKSEDDAVAGDAKACVFYLKRRLRAASHMNSEPEITPNKFCHPTPGMLHRSPKHPLPGAGEESR